MIKLYIYIYNSGVCVARNKALENVTGNYVLFLDSDGTLYNNTLRVLYENIKKYDYCDIACFGYYQSESSQWFPHIIDTSFISKKDIKEKYLPYYLNIISNQDYDLKVFVWNKCFNASFIKKHNLEFDYGRRTWEDRLFMIECFDKAESLILLDEILYNEECVEKISHLSQKIYENQLHNYILDQEYYWKKYESIYNFDIDNYITFNINNLLYLLDRYFYTFGKSSIPIISDMLKNQIVYLWMEKFMPRNFFEFKFKQHISHNEINKLYKLYCSKIRKRIMRKIKI